MTIRLADMDRLFIVAETKQRSGLYLLLHLPDLNVPLDLASNIKWALFSSVHATRISQQVLLMAYFQFTWWLMRTSITYYCWVRDLLGHGRSIWLL